MMDAFSCTEETKMSNIHADPKNFDPATSPAFTGPARWVAAFVLITGPLLQVIEFLAENETADPAARVALWAAHPAQIGVSMASGLLAMPFLLGAIAVLVTLTKARSQRLAWIGATFMTFGMVGLAAAHGYELAAYGLTLSGNLDAAIATLNGDMLGLPGAVLFAMFLGGALLGTLALATAAWRSPLVPRIVVIFMLAFAVLDFAVGQGVVSHLVNLVGFVILAVAVVSKYSRQPGTVTAAAVQPGP
jgi:hypothetical protein